MSYYPGEREARDKAVREFGEVLGAAQRAFMRPENLAEATLALSRALAIVTVELSRVAKGRTFQLLTLYQEFNVEPVRSILQNPHAFLRDVAGMPGGVPKDVEAEVRDSTPDQKTLPP